MQRILFGSMVILCIVTSAVAQHNSSQPVGLKHLYRLDLLPRFRRSIEIGSISSYDRTGGNDDGFSGKYSFVTREDDGFVIAELKGPGIIYRIWTPTPTDDMLEFYFDGETKPRIGVPFRQLFTGTHPPFITPLVGYGGGGFYSYVPLAYHKSCKIKIRAKRIQFYQINYARYGDDVPIASWTPRDDHQAVYKQISDLFSKAGMDISRWTTPPDAAAKIVKSRVVLASGSSATLFETHTGGRIVGLRIAPASALIGKDRDIVLRIRWDDQRQLAVNCPAGDFFGFAWGRPAMASLLLGTAHDTCYCYFPMPFDRSSKVELVSQRTGGPPLRLRAETITVPVKRAPDEGWFYAVWRRENPTKKGVPYTFLDTRGKGHVVGCVLQAQGMV